VVRDVKALFDLTGQTALVTGGGSGLGHDMALALAEAGANLVVPDVKGELAEDTAAQVRELGREALGLELDVADPQAVARCFDATCAHFGGLDILVNNAGIGVLGASEDATRSDWQRVFDVNVGGMFDCCQRAGRLMLDRGRGKIINIASIYGMVGTDGRLYEHTRPMTHQGIAYNASKGAVISLTRSLAVEWAPRGVFVNAIAPGMMNNGRNRPDLETRTWDNLAERTPMRRTGTGADLRGAVIFLASAASDFVTGHVLVVDGGWTAW
jgi:NAD(P)-dependent dehydrogenase (short-subunit alcohol dehydrogenase family)